MLVRHFLQIYIFIIFDIHTHVPNAKTCTKEYVFIFKYIFFIWFDYLLLITSFTWYYL